MSVLSNLSLAVFLTLLCLAIEHIAIRYYRWTPHITLRYALGVIAGLAPLTALALLAGRSLSWWEPWLPFVAGGALVMVLHLTDSAIETRRDLRDALERERAMAELGDEG